MGRSAFDIYLKLFSLTIWTFRWAHSLDHRTQSFYLVGNPFVNFSSKCLFWIIIFSRFLANTIRLFSSVSCNWVAVRWPRAVRISWILLVMVSILKSGVVLVVVKSSLLLFWLNSWKSLTKYSSNFSLTCWIESSTFSFKFWKKFSNNVTNYR